ncbi:acetyl-CoA carboxylase biotin carboxyl carrier protein subunit [Streptomyces roseirectus]|uniref:Biotin carboxyl carrier protein of acetyl-CoA carboxylase n=1 Tax=Streptomyces roseirectus TaxID=2768066 RepID=A0A7H0IPG7_9ACTN|nr:biotin/lipoyl-containing protein [Streptomyces roseirectus]QNP74683.1 acetyl-CoA carboxylase biotin carboxyl carrier protein subunit [Streptomyces roseirectus]
MTSLRPASDGDTAVGGEESELLERVRDAVVDLLAELPGAPARLRVRVQGVEMELDWAAPPAGPAAPAPQAVQAAPAPVHVLSPDTATSGDGGPPPAWASVTSSTVGTFYRSPEPGAEPFVRVGEQVKPGQQVAIIEVMKLMIPVEADRDAVITEVLAEDGQSVEYGQPLFALGPVS